MTQCAQKNTHDGVALFFNNNLDLLELAKSDFYLLTSQISTFGQTSTTAKRQKKKSNRLHTTDQPPIKVRKIQLILRCIGIIYWNLLLLLYIFLPDILWWKMRQLKGKVKETRKQKKERKLENIAIHNKIKTIVLPAMGVLALLIIVFVYVKTRPAIEA